MANWNITVDKSVLWNNFSPKSASVFNSAFHDATEHAKHNVKILPELTEKSSIRRIRWKFYYPIWVQTEGDLRKLVEYVRSSLSELQGFSKRSGSGSEAISLDSISAALGRLNDLVEGFEKIFDNSEVGTVPGNISVDDFTVSFAYDGEPQPTDAHYGYKLDARAFWITDDDLPDDQTFGAVTCTAFEYDLGLHADNNDPKKSSDTLRSGAFEQPLVSVGPTLLTNRLHNLAFVVDANSQVHELIGTRTFGTLIFGLVLYVKVGTKDEVANFLAAERNKEIGLLLEDLAPGKRLAALASAVALSPAEAQLVMSVGLGVENPAAVLTSGLSADSLKVLATSLGMAVEAIPDPAELSTGILERVGAV